MSNDNKGLIMAGGNGTRLFPLTIMTNKHLLPIYSKPLIYYSIAQMVLLNIKEICLIVRPQDADCYFELKNHFVKFGIKIEIIIQKNAGGIPEGLILAENFIGDSDFLFMLGDNFLYGSGLIDKIKNVIADSSSNYIFSCFSNSPEKFGVILYEEGKIIKLVEKPRELIGNDVAIGLYKYKSNVVQFAKLLQPSERNELEITDLNNQLISEGLLRLERIDRGTVWLDCGSTESIFEASMYVKSLEELTGNLILSPEEASIGRNISKKQFFEIIDQLPENEYVRRLKVAASARK